MKEILLNAHEYLECVFVRAVAHELSAESHRSVGTRWGIVSTVLSAIVGSALFVSLSDKFGLTGKNDLTFSFASWPQQSRILAYTFTGLILILAPILTNVQAFLNQPQQVESID